MYELRLMLLALFGLAALYCAASTMGIWMRRRRLSYFGCALATAFAVVTVVILIVPVPVQPSGVGEPARADLQGRSSGLWKRYSAAQQAEVEEMQRDLAPSLESYRQAHGEYPPTLPVAGIPLPETRYGPDSLLQQWNLVPGLRRRSQGGRIPGGLGQQNAKVDRQRVRHVMHG